MRPLPIRTVSSEAHQFLLPVKTEVIDGQEYLYSFWEWRSDGWQLVTLDTPLSIGDPFEGIK